MLCIRDRCWLDCLSFCDNIVLCLSTSSLLFIKWLKLVGLTKIHLSFVLVDFMGKRVASNDCHLVLIESELYMSLSVYFRSPQTMNLCSKCYKGEFLYFYSTYMFGYQVLGS